MNDDRIRVVRDKIWEYYRDNARDLPWRDDPTPYQVLVSEVMLQQTQVSRVRVKYAEWMRAFPTLESLAAASVAEVIAAWQGLGYNRRGLWLLRAAQQIVNKFGGVLPRDPALLVTLPGIGPNTAGSMAAFAYNEPVVFIETNIRRVFIHEFFGDGDGIDDKELLPLIEAALDREEPRQWYYALMDYGSWLVKQVPNPNRRSKHHAVQSKFAGSPRQVRGEILRQVLLGPLGRDEMKAIDERAPKLADQLASEGFLVVVEGRFQMVR